MPICLNISFPFLNNLSSLLRCEGMKMKGEVILCCRNNVLEVWRGGAVRGGTSSCGGEYLTIFDAVFQWHDKKTNSLKDKYFWEFNDQRMQVSADSPKLIGELFLQCPKEILDPFKQAHSCVFTNTYALFIYNFFLLSFFQSYTFKK